MRIEQTARGRFSLMAENAADHAFLDALDFERHVHVASMERAQAPSHIGCNNVGACVVVDRASPQALEIQAGRETLRAVRQFAGLFLGQPANDGLAAAPTQPQAQEQLAAGLVQLQRVVDTLCVQVRQVELVLKEMQGAHTASKTVGKAAILTTAEGGAA